MQSPALWARWNRPPSCGGSLSSLIALVLITTFIVWMIRHGSDMVGSMEKDAAANLSGKGILLLSAFMTAREGVEIAIFSFAGEYSIAGIFVGIGIALVLVVLIYYSLVRVNLKTIFTVTLIYLILQAGFLLGYGIHEGLSALKDLGVLAGSNPCSSKHSMFPERCSTTKPALSACRCTCSSAGTRNLRSCSLRRSTSTQPRSSDCGTGPTKHLLGTSMAA